MTWQGEKQERKAEALEKIEAAKNAYTVGQLADEYFTKNILGRWKHPKIVRLRIEKDIKPNIGILDDDFLADVRNLPERNLAEELLQRLLEGEIKSRFAGNVVQEKKFSELLANVIKRYQNRAIETAQVIEELIQMAKKFR